MSLAIALVAVFALSQALTFGVLLYFAVQFTHVKNLALSLEDELDGHADAIANLQNHMESTQRWADSVTDLQGAIVERLNGDN